MSFPGDPGAVFASSHDLRHALRRSRVRCEILLVLLVLTRATASDIAHRTGIEPLNIRGALYGDRLAYRVDHSLMLLGLVATKVDRGDVVYELTLRGRQVALDLRRELVAQMSRPAGARS